MNGEIKKSKSYLDTSFKHVSFLASFKEQRRIQSDMIIEFNPEKLLSIGIGYGDEIIALIDFYRKKHPNLNYLGNLRHLECVDLHEDAGENIVISNYSTLNLTININNRYDILELQDNEEWDCILCSFVLHDINFEDKNNVIDRLYKALKPNGKIIISEMFLDNNSTDMDSHENHLRMNEVEKLYESFIKEINNTAELSINTKNDLINHVIRTIKDAKLGKRDYFMNLEQTKNLLLSGGFQINNSTFFTPNKIVDYLGVIVARKPKLIKEEKY